MPPPSEWVKLVIEPTGACEVVVVDENGQPVGGPLEARLRFVGADARGSFDAPKDPGEVLASRTGPGVVFERVALGHALAVEVTREGSDARLQVTGPGPSRVGERVRLQVRV